MSQKSYSIKAVVTFLLLFFFFYTKEMRKRISGVIQIHNQNGLYHVCLFTGDVQLLLVISLKLLLMTMSQFHCHIVLKLLTKTENIELQKKHQINNKFYLKYIFLCNLSMYNTLKIYQCIILSILIRHYASRNVNDNVIIKTTFHFHKLNLC